MDVHKRIVSTQLQIYNENLLLLVFSESRKGLEQRFPKWVPRNPRVPQTNLKGSTSCTFQF